MVEIDAAGPSLFYFSWVRLWFWESNRAEGEKQNEMSSEENEMK